MKKYTMNYLFGGALVTLLSFGYTADVSAQMAVYTPPVYNNAGSQPYGQAGYVQPGYPSGYYGDADANYRAQPGYPTYAPQAPAHYIQQPVQQGYAYAAPQQQTVYYQQQAAPTRQVVQAPYAVSGDNDDAYYSKNGVASSGPTEYQYDY